MGETGPRKARRPVPAAVPQAGLTRRADQTAKAPPRVIAESVLDVFAVKNQAEREAIVDLKV